MDEFLCQKQLFEMFPLVAKVVAIYAVFQTSCRGASEAFFLIAHLCGKIEEKGTRWKWVGKTAWIAGIFFNNLGYGVSKQYLDKKYEPRLPKRTDDAGDRPVQE
jgi:hypothetical protein